MQIILFIIALSMDVFLACLACGTEQIKIGNKAALCISGVCSGVLFLSLLAGSFLENILVKQYTDVLCFLGLFLVGAFKLIEYAVKRYIRKHKFLCKRIKISFSQLNFILSIYNNPVMADLDHSATMSVVEAVFFAIAMSADGLFGGLGAGLMGIHLGWTVLWNFVVGFFAVKAGSAVGVRVSKKWDMDLSWLGGVLFVLLAFRNVASG